MTTEMIDTLYSKRTRNSLGKLISPRQDLTFKRLKIYYEENGYDLNDKFLNNLELYTGDNKLNYAAYLLADENGISMKTIQRNIKKLQIEKIVERVGTDKDGYWNIVE